MDKELIVIPSAGMSGGSPRGLSYWLSFLGCRRKKNLEEGYYDATKSAANVGTLFHKMLELYYSGELENTVLEYQEGAEDPDWQETLRLFKEYRTRFPADEFGNVVGCETPIEQTYSGLFGVAPVSGRIDMVVDVTEEAIETLKKSRPGMGELEPGIYLLDTKTKGKKSAHLPMQMESSLQFSAYQMMWNEAHPDTPCKGMIANVVIRHKRLVDSSFMSILVGPPTEVQKEVVRSTLKLCEQIKDQIGEDFCNTTQCFQFGICPFLQNGMCMRV